MKQNRTEEGWRTLELIPCLLLEFVGILLSWLTINSWMTYSTTFGTRNVLTTRFCICTL